MSNTTKTKGNIYSLARLAKERLKQNNYTKVKGNVINNACTFAEYISKQKEVENIKILEYLLSKEFICLRQF